MTNIFGNLVRTQDLRVRFCSILLGILSMVAVSTETFAQDIEITPFGGYRFGGSFTDFFTETTLDIDDSESYGVVLGFKTSRETMFELLYSHQTTNLNASSGFVSRKLITDLDIDYFQLGGSYIWNPRKDYRPYLQGTLGVSHFSPDRAGLSSETMFAFTLGGGVKYFFTKHLGINLGARAMGNVLNSSSAIFCSSGCSISVSASTLWQFEGTAGIIFAF